MLFILLPAHRALVWSVLCAYLILPVGTSFEMPFFPSLDKTTVSNLSILLCCLLLVRENWLRALKEPVLMTLAATFTLSPFITATFNAESLVFGGRFIPPMSMYDAFAQSVLNVITLIPFIAAYGLINNDQRRWHVIIILVSGALAYSVLMLIEVRLSPQLHRMIYGFFPHSFGQQMRAGGFRPVVFLGHGLLVAIFCAMALTAAIARWREARGPIKMRAGLIVTYFAILLLLCKSTGAIILAAVFAPLIAFLRAKRLAAISAAACITILLYPAIRSAGLVPIATISDLTASYSADRAGSLGVRLINEDQLLERVSEKPVFGWGSWGRNRIYSPDNGSDLSTTDGAWIITIGTWGWVGYLAMFGLLCAGCVRLLWRRSSQVSISMGSAAICVLLAINLLDSIPNASIRPITWLFAGAIFAIRAKEGGQSQTSIR
ncbi:hypothetical protein [Allopontixanthobacter sediminis]|uniref:O-antigen ligase like membrane protein n=1 Tax=Allopontixanthobacter sediminis TaxID=1689985 RepID=A0A845B5A9_9SPHN|nr:hypothetical protein [Allopontixanthobacter sediminis]MXP44617.1 hypothetical protein [Allopontixanthobacter sediminis]